MRLMLFLVVFVFKSAISQPIPEPAYPQGYFRNPLNIPILLSGNFGELRPNHYHMGLDLKTQARENLPVHAAAAGYVSRVKIEPGGFGRAIYINHPNGYTTLYAHLNRFYPALEAWIKQKQYEAESWSVALEPNPEQFPVSRGDFIAYSGNTGGSQAPHVHFEIRRTEDDVNLNPLLFGFQIADRTKPSILRMAVYDRNKSIYEQSPRIIPVKAAATGSFVTNPRSVIVSSDKISLAFTGYDTQSGSSNLNGIYQARLLLDGQPVIDFRMDNISYNDTRYLNAHIDYRLRAVGGAYLQNLSQLPGYTNSIYTQYINDGVLDLSDGAVHDIQVEVRDANNNRSFLRSKIQYKPGVATKSPERPDGKDFYPMMLDGFETDDCEFFIGEKCLYDRVRIRYWKDSSDATALSAAHRIGDSYIPLQQAFLIRIKPRSLLNEYEQSRTVMQWVSGSKKGVMKVEWKDGWGSASFRDFGTFKLLLDTTPPVIVPIGFADGSNLSKASRIVFTVRDNNSKIRSVRPELNGKWLRFTNDKFRNYIYVFDEHCPRGRHELKVFVEDEAGNQTLRTFKFTR